MGWCVPVPGVVCGGEEWQALPWIGNGYLSKGDCIDIGIGVGIGIGTGDKISSKRTCTLDWTRLGWSTLCTVVRIARMALKLRNCRGVSAVIDWQSHLFVNSHRTVQPYRWFFLKDTEFLNKYSL